jgi:DNA-binding transcriptional LysR family regulator
LSRRIQSLEAAVGAPLLERTTRRVSSTVVGRLFAPRARQFLSDLEEALLETVGTATKVSGQISIACVPTATTSLIPRAIRQFSEKFPNIRFKILDGSANEGLEWVRGGEAEFGINLIGASESDLQFTPLLEDPFVLICPKDHKLAKRRRVVWKDVQGETLIGLSRSSGNRNILESALTQRRLSARFQFEVNHLTTALSLVHQGLGLTILPNLAVPKDDGNSFLTRKIISDLNVSRTIGLLERRSGNLSAAARKFRDILVG